MMKKYLASAALAVSALLAVPASAAIVVTFNPSSQHVNIGETVTVDVNISGLGSEILSATDLNFFYNGTVIGVSRSLDLSTAFDQLGGAPLISAIDVDSLGEWGLQLSAVVDDATLEANQANDFLLARFTFSADANGVSRFALGLDPDIERNFVGLNFATLDVTVGSACIAVGTGVCNDIPEPSTTALLGLALAGALLPGTLRRRREKCL